MPLTWNVGIVESWSKPHDFRVRLKAFGIIFYSYSMNHFIFQPDGTQMYPVFHHSIVPLFPPGVGAILRAGGQLCAKRTNWLQAPQHTASPAAFRRGLCLKPFSEVRILRTQPYLFQRGLKSITQDYRRIVNSGKWGNTAG